MNKLNLEKNDEFLNLKKTKQSIYDEILNETKKDISLQNIKAKEYIDAFILPEIINANKIGVTIRRFSLNNVKFNILTKLIVNQLQELGFTAFIKESDDNSKNYLYITYSINQEESISTTIDSLKKNYKSTLNIEDKFIEDFIHNNIKTKIKKANRLGKKDLEIELPANFSNIQMVSKILNSLIYNKLDTEFRFINNKSFIYINWSKEFIKETPINIHSIIKSNILYEHEDIFNNKENTNLNYKITKKGVLKYKTNLARVIGDISTGINMLIELEEHTSFDFTSYNLISEDNLKEALNIIQNSCSNLIKYIKEQNLIALDILENVYIYTKSSLITSLYFCVENTKDKKMSKDLEDIKNLINFLNELLIDAENIINIIDYKIVNIHNFDIWQHLDKTLFELQRDLSILNGSSHNKSNDFIINWVLKNTLTGIQNKKNNSNINRDSISDTNSNINNNIKFIKKSKEDPVQ